MISTLSQAQLEAMEHGRYVFFDTETTGLKPSEGHRIIEVGAIEVVDRQITGRQYHCLVNPLRDSDERAIEVHGHSNESLQDKPLFEAILPEMTAFFDGAILIAHNASFDVGFLDAELERIDGNEQTARQRWRFVDSLAVAQRLHPGQPNSLDVLCRRYQVDASRRVKHGALIDSELLAEVYIAMTSYQMSVLGEKDHQSQVGAEGAKEEFSGEFLPIPAATRKIVLTDAEKAAHQEFIKTKLNGDAPFGDW